MAGERLAILLKSLGKYLSCFALVIPSITAPTVSRCEGFGAKLILIFYRHWLLYQLRPKWYLHLRQNILGHNLYRQIHQRYLE
jgi:hypothetical protein